MLQTNNGVLPVELGINLLCYNLCGDPAVPLGAPDFNIEVTSFNGDSTGESELRLTAYEKASLQAAITGKDGKLLDTFDGTAIIDVYDTPKTLKNLLGDSYDVIADDAIAATFSAPVKNGIIKATFAVPAPRTEGGLHRIVLTAIEDNNDRQAVGVLQGIIINKSDDNYSSDIDSSAPIIEDFYINDSNFRSGDVTSSVFDIYATIRACGTGIAIDNTGIANASQLRIDGKLLKNAAAALQPDTDGNYKLQYTAGPLSAGRHSLTFKVVSNSGESTTASLDFVVDNVIEGVIMADATDPVREQVNLSIEANNIDIANTASRSNQSTALSYTHTKVAQVSWNLTDKNGDPVHDGIYRVRALFTTAEGLGHTAPIELIVVK